MNRNRRSLETISGDLLRALRSEAKSVVKVGLLLIEAKEQLDEHGAWLSWLAKNFPGSVRSAQAYMSVGRLAIKYAKLAHLDFTASAPYALAAIDNGAQPEDANAIVEAVLLEAKTGRVNAERVEEIAEAYWRRVEAERAAEDEDAEEEVEAEGEDIEEPPPGAEGCSPPNGDAGKEPPPVPPEGEDPAGVDPPDDSRPPPPPPSLTPKQQALILQFEGFTKGLAGLAARPARGFVASAIPTDVLENVISFVTRILEERRRRHP
jgi:hypothetical protein